MGRAHRGQGRKSTPAKAMSSCHSAKSEEIIIRVMANINTRGSHSESSGEGGVVLSRRGAPVWRWGLLPLSWL